MKILNGFARRIVPMLLIAATLGFGSSGCTLYDPYLDERPRGGKLALLDEENTAAPLPLLRGAGASAHDLYSEAYRKRDFVVWGRATASLVAFGAAAAGGVAALYGAHPDLVLGLGLSAAGSYTAGNLFLQQDKVALYMNAGSALNCVVSNVESVVATVPRIDEQINGANVVASKIGAVLSEADDDLKQRAKEALANFRQAEAAWKLFLASDASFAAKVNETSDLIVGMLNDHIANLQPDLSAVVAAASGIGGMATSYSIGAVPGEADDSSTEGKDTDAKTANATLERLTPELEVATAVITTTITDQTNRMAELGKTCVLGVPPDAGPLTVNDTNVTISPDEVIRLTTTGGRQVLSVRWLDTPPDPKNLEALTTAGPDVLLIGKSTLQGPGEYKLRISDSSAAPKHVDVTVVVPGETAAPDESSEPVEEEGEGG